MVAGFFAGLADLAHCVEVMLVNGDGVVAHGTVTCTRHDGSALSVPFANMFRVAHERIRDYRIFADVSRLC